MIDLKAPEPFKEILEKNREKHSIFLAGSIEMGKATEWQKEVTSQFADSNVIILNPRRTNWDNSWIPDISNPNFYEQVMWELEGAELADHILMYLEPSTMAPISLLELGLASKSKDIWVCCPEGYWRRGNIQVVTKKFGIPMYNDLNEMIKAFREDFNL